MEKEIILLFDLDDTLLIEEDSAYDALFETSKVLLKYKIDPANFTETIKAKAREIWKTLPTYQYCLDIGISSWEGLWANFIGENPNLKKLNTLKNQYHINSWNNALKEYSINNNDLAKKLSGKFNIERRKRHILFPETINVLNKLKKNYKMGLITNGSPDLQWEKINGSNIRSYFDKIIISCEVDIAKPNKKIFNYAFNFFKNEKAEYIMIGNSLYSDICGAFNAGIKSVWVNRNNKSNNSGFKPDYQISNLNQLFDILKLIE